LRSAFHAPIVADMKKRFAAAVLWFYAGWVVGAMFAFAAGLTPIVAPMIGLLAAAMVARDPLSVVWSKAGSDPHNRD
jgi:hypothetical protein